MIPRSYEAVLCLVLINGSSNGDVMPIFRDEKLFFLSSASMEVIIYINGKLSWNMLESFS
jgi:hypothetical protein